MDSSLDMLLRRLVREETEPAIRAALVGVFDELRALRHEVARLNGEGREYMTAEEAAEYSRHAISTVRQWVDGGYLSRCGTPRKLLIRKKELERFLENRPRNDEGVIDFEERATALLRED